MLDRLLGIVYGVGDRCGAVVYGRRRRRSCFHHDHITGQTWIRSQLVDLGRAKHYWCTRCRRYWT